MTATVLQLPRTVATIDVARLTRPRTYARGVDYVRRGLVEITACTTTSVTATVIGTEPYRVHVEIAHGDVTHRCTCPVGTDGAFCKHLVATALAAAGADTDVVGPLVAPVDLAARRRAREGDGWATAAHGIVDLVETLFATGRADEVVDFCRDAVDCLEANAAEINDVAALAGLIDRLGDLHRRASSGRRPRPA